MLLNAGADAIVTLGVIAFGDADVLHVVKNNLARMSIYKKEDDIP